MVLMLARRTLVVSVTLVLLNGVSFVVLSQELPESRRQEKWRLSWNIVDRGVVSSGDAKFISEEDCRAAKDKAIQRKKEELQSLGNDVTENDATIIIERRREDRAVLTIVQFYCTEERDWIIVIAHYGRGAVSEDRIGSFSTAEQCIDALELEVDFKAKSLQKLGYHVSAERPTTTNWTVTTKAFGTEAGPPHHVTTYRCIAE